jgi:peptidase E
MRRIVAIGGGGFLMEDDPSPIDHYLLRLTSKARPRVCFIPTPSGDSEEHLNKFYATFNSERCIPSHLAFFRKPRAGALPLAGYAAHLLAQDLIFVGGGNTRSALAVWREWGVDRVLAQAWERGVILSGMSAGALCWFEVAVSDSFFDGTYRPINGIGLLAGACAAHYNALPERRPLLQRAVEAGEVPDAIAIDIGAAVVFSGSEVERVVSWCNGCTAYRVFLTGKTVREEAVARHFVDYVEALRDAKNNALRANFKAAVDAKWSPDTSVPIGMSEHEFRRAKTT